MSVAVDFGDGSPPRSISAEALARGALIDYEYEKPVAARLHVAAAQQDDPFAPDAVLLGSGSTIVTVHASAITTAQALSAALWNTRFALSLLIAATVYYWRFHTGKKVFGAQGFDYVEAFALGFVVHAAVSNLPAQIARVVSLS